MLVFLLYTVMAIVATACLTKILHISIQPGQWIDQLFRWQQKLQQWDMQGKQLFAKVGGYCEVCFSHAVSFASYWVHVFFMKQVAGFWITAHVQQTSVVIGINIVWYVVYVSICTNLSLYFIVKLFQK